ncbi:MAG: CCA tRNA nucleotidyltransferase [Gemmatimonadetes bacterium]|nr:CCA tRNA nucleotidyltransferase [Gemmatimonadota bacterium]
MRDAVLGLPAQDWDLATRARPADIRRLFRRTVPIGIEHGTVGVLGRDGVLYEVTTFRRDIETFGRHAVVEFANSVEEDLARRDFTINALAWDPATEELRDPYGGLADLRAGVLRTVGHAEERFAEDYLRVLRALRFAGQFRLTIERRTWDALVAATPNLPRLSAERVREELMKVLAKSRCASAALSLYAAAGVLAVLYPELDALVGLFRSPSAPVDAWTESLLAVDALPPSRPTLRLAALLHLIGAPAARTRDLRGGWRFTGHEVIGARKAEELLRRLKASNAEIARVARLVRHQSDLFPPDAGGPTIRRWLRLLGPDLVNDFWRLRFALWRAGEPARAGVEPPPRPDDLLERHAAAGHVIRQRPPLQVSDLAIGGAELRALGIPQGPRYGKILRALLERVTDDPELNTRDSLLDLVREEIEP